MIEADGKSCHVYTSPHLIRFNERIAVNGEEIDNARLLPILEELEGEYEKYKHEIKLTFFELTTIAAFMAFARSHADYTLLETGMGGRYDATNLFTKPLLTVITPISIDHTEFLGSTIADIAYEKAGIIKPGVTCISAPQVSEAKKVLEAAGPITFAEIPKSLPQLALNGAHQKINAATAIAAARNLGLSEIAIQQGLTSAKWNARMQRLKHGALADMLPAGYELWLDGAHNLAGAESLAAEIKGPTYLIIGMLNNKDAHAYLNAFKGKIKGIYAIPIPGGHNDFKPEELKNIAQNLEIKAFAATDAASAIKDILQNDKSPSSIFICGSLYLAGHILESNYERPSDRSVESILGEPKGRKPVSSSG